MRVFIVVAFAAMMLSGCAAMPDRDRNTLIGAGVGAGVGALIGSAVGGPAGTAVGATIGGTTGGVVGYLIRPEGCYFRNKRGELWQVPCEDRVVRSEACFAGHRHGELQQVSCQYSPPAR